MSYRTSPIIAVLAWIALTSVVACSGQSTPPLTGTADGATGDVVPAGDVQVVADAEDATSGDGGAETSGLETVVQDASPDGVDAEPSDVLGAPDGADALPETTQDAGVDALPGDAPQSDGIAADGGASQTLPATELLVKILGPTGSDWGQSAAEVTQLAGVVMGDVKEISWSNGIDPPVTMDPVAFWTSDYITLKPGDNVLTVTAKNDEETVSDTLRIVYNPLYSFEDAPRIRPDVVYVGESNTLIANIPLTGASGADSIVDPSGIKLVEVDSVTFLPVKEYGVMQDNGQIGNCDDIQKDAVFSSCISLQATKTQDYCFRVSAPINFKDVNIKYTAMSPVTCIEAVKRLDQASCTQVVLAQTQAKAAYAGAVEGKGKDVALVEAIAGLKANAAVKDAGPGADGKGIWVHYKSGVVGAVSLAEPGDRSGGGGGGAVAGESVETNNGAVGSRRVLTWAPFSSEFANYGGDEAVAAGLKMAAKDCPPFTVDSRNGSAATVSYFRNLDQYGVVALTTHGGVFFKDLDLAVKQGFGWEHTGSQEVLWSGEPVNCAALSTSTKSCSTGNQGGNPCPEGQECVVTKSGNTGVCVDYLHADIAKGRVVIGAETYGVTPQMVSRHATKPFPDSIVYLGSCRSYWNGGFVLAFFGRGAKAVAGYSDLVTSAFAYERGLGFLTNLIDSGMSANQAFPMSGNDDPDHPGSQFRWLGDGKANAASSELINPSFELSDTTGWTREGDGRVISRLGVTIPVSGKFMGIISTGLGFTTQNGLLAQSFCIPPSKNQFCFWWKYYSEEFKEWCGSGFQDTFIGSLKADIGQIEMVNVAVDDLCGYQDGSCGSCEPGSPSCKCGKQYKGLTPADVSFDQGGVFNIQWQSSCADVSPLAGQGKVDLKFFTTDKGDSIYDTVILLDDCKVK